MALQSSGQISLQDIQDEFGGSHPISLSEYYGVDTVPASGAISFNDFYGTELLVGINGANVSFFNKISTSYHTDGFYGTKFGMGLDASATRIVVGTVADSPANNQGSFIIFDADGNEIADITAFDGAESDSFGAYVAVSDSANKIVVGSPSSDPQGSLSGSAYIYDLNGNFQTKLIAPDGVAGDNFGSDVAVSNSRIVIGAEHHPFAGGLAGTGAVYLYDTNGNFQTKITAHDGAAGDKFGGTVAMSDSVIVVSARSDDVNGSNSGSAYLYDINGNFQTKITAPDGAASDMFGIGVAVSNSAIVIGAWQDDDMGNDSGSAYIYDINGNFQTKLIAPDGAAGDNFGVRVAVSDNAIVVSAYGDDDMGNNSGSAYIYKEVA